MPQVLERRHNVNMRVNMKQRGNCFGEVALLYNCPRSATVAATQDSVAWVLDRDILRCNIPSHLTLALTHLPSLDPTQGCRGHESFRRCIT